MGRIPRKLRISSVVESSYIGQVCKAKTVENEKAMEQTRNTKPHIADHTSGASRSWWTGEWSTPIGRPISRLAH